MEQYVCSHHGKNSTHDTARCYTLQAQQSRSTKSSTGRSPEAALVTPPFDHESDEGLDDTNFVILTVDVNMGPPYQWSPPSPSFLSQRAEALSPSRTELGPARSSPTREPAVTCGERTSAL